MVGTKEASRTICRTVARMVMVMFMVMWKSNQADCHQAIRNAHRNYQASWIDVDSIALQEPLPLSKMGYLKIEPKDYNTSGLALTIFYFTNRLPRV